MSDQTEATLPPELEPKKGPGRPKGSKTKPKEPMPDDAVLRAWLGFWTLLQLATWAVGRFFVRADQEVELLKLTDKEAMDDAQSLRPFLESHPAIMNTLAFIGAPVAILRRVKDKLQVKHKELVEEPAPPAPLRVAPEAPQAS